TAERNLDALLRLILASARALTQADSGTIWVVEARADGRRLHNKASQNDSVNVAHREFAVPIDPTSIAGWVALTGESLCLEAVYALPADGQPSSAGSRAFDQQTGYRTRSMLAVPVKDRAGAVIGVIQLMNRKRRGDAVLKDPDAVAGQVIPFSRGRLA